MKIVYMGTPAFAVPTLRALVEAGHEVVAVITQPDRKKDRGKKLGFSEVKQTAVELGLPVLQPERLRGNDELLMQLSAMRADCFVVAAYGRILPAQILNMPPLGCFNLHGSLLPKYRGAAPVHRAILDGEPVTGVTIMKMDEGLDTGDLLSSRRVKVGGKTAAQLMQELAQAGASLLVKTLPEIEAGTIKPIKQDEGSATYAPMIKKEEGLIDFKRSAEEIERKVRGLIPWPMAYTQYRSETVKIWEARVAPDGYLQDRAHDIKPKKGYEPGEIVSADKDAIAVATGEGILLVTRLQFPGKKAVDVKDYLLGNKIEEGERFGA